VGAAKSTKIVAGRESNIKFFPTLDGLRLFEAAKYAGNLASNLELALTTMPSDDDQEIS
jgi:hypothetical protein